MKYLIEKLWVDSMENEVGNAYGYKPYGYVDTLEEACDFVGKSKVYNQQSCWAFNRDMPEFIYTELPKL